MNIFLWVFILFFSSSAWANKKAFDEYKSKVEVPEPLYIDLVRSLSAEAGEWEINSLFYHSQGTYGDLKWSPEVEVVIREGSAIEFEFPMKGGNLNSYKLAFQQRIYENKKANGIHGFQFIYEANKRFNKDEGTFYYIVAHRFNHYLSTIGLYGVKSLIKKFEGLEVQLNQSIFYNYSREIDLGIEINYASDKLENKYFQIVPQLHLAFTKGYKIQFGFGALDKDSKVSPVGVLRFIKEFNH